MISRRSRYANAIVGLVKSSRGDVVTIMPKEPEPWAFNFTYIMIQDGDRPDLIANRMLGDDALWWRIADANPEIMDWTELTSGTVIRIPNV